MPNSLTFDCSPPPSALVSDPYSVGEIDSHPDADRIWATIIAMREDYIGNPSRMEKFEQCLRIVCHHLELPQSENSLCDDSSKYDRALDALKRANDTNAAMYNQFREMYFRTSSRLEMLQKMLG